MPIQFPPWDGLPVWLKQDLTERVAAPAGDAWNAWDSDQRLRLLNVVVVLKRYGLWIYVDSLTFGTLTVEDRWGRANDKVTFTPAISAWWLAVTTKTGVEVALEEVGFDDRFNLNHAENMANYMEPGDGTVMHWGRLKPPFDHLVTLHFDSGGGRIWSREHFHEFWHGGGMTTEEVTADIAKTPAGHYLKGICAELDELLRQAHVDQIFGQ